MKIQLILILEESKKEIYDQSSFDTVKPRFIGIKSKYPATPLKN